MSRRSRRKCEVSRSLLYVTECRLAGKFQTRVKQQALVRLSNDCDQKGFAERINWIMCLVYEQQKKNVLEYVVIFGVLEQLLCATERGRGHHGKFEAMRPH